jgi:dihydroorotate dehydrogenase electron transfer subunit
MTRWTKCEGWRTVPELLSTSLPQVARIVERVDETDRVRTLVFDLHVEGQPGQFVMAWLPGVDEKPFSLVAAQPVTLAVARVGSFTDAVFQLDAGDRMWLRGPLGRPFHLPVPGSEGAGQAPGDLLLVGGGYGIAPLSFLAEWAIQAGWGVDVVIGARTAADVFYVDRLGALGARVLVTTDDGSLGERGLATDAARRLLDQQDYRGLYACGPESMLEAVISLALSRGIPAQLSYERYMRCGLGVCGSCSRQGWLVCRDGPVRQVVPVSAAESSP